MAKCDLKSGFSLCFFTCFWIAAVAYSHDEFLYDTGPKISDNFINIRLLHSLDGHKISKRNVETVHPILIASSTTPMNKLNGSITTSTVAPRINNDKDLKSALDAINLSSSDTMPQKLGVNGSGQRKFDITPTTSYKLPPLVHDIGSTMDDVRSNKNEIEKKHDDLNVEIADSIFDDSYGDFLQDVDTDEDDIEKNLHENNITSIKNDTHIFYNSSIFVDPQIGQTYWVDLEDDQKGTVNHLLSNSHRRAATVKLSFDFPFYGNLIKNVTIATGGFLYTGNYVHSWLAATQYIAPLMANFDTSLSNSSNIMHHDNGTAFTVQWHRVQLKDKPKDGEFTFQVTLLKTGDIVFVYKNVPLQIEAINNIHHPVKIGLSDAYILDKTMFYVRRKTIYEYHRVAFVMEEIKNWTSIYLTALPTCQTSTSCPTCLTGEIADKYKCKWCPKLNMCSTGWDRNRQIWTDGGCETDQIGLENMCHIKIVPGDHYETTFSYNPEVLAGYSRSRYELNRPKGAQRIGVSGWLAILFLIVMGTGLALWITYAYRNPHSFSGQILIRESIPSAWHIIDDIKQLVSAQSVEMAAR